MVVVISVLVVVVAVAVAATATAAWSFDVSCSDAASWRKTGLSKTSGGDGGNDDDDDDEHSPSLNLQIYVAILTPSLLRVSSNCCMAKMEPTHFFHYLAS